MATYYATEANGQYNSSGAPDLAEQGFRRAVKHLMMDVYEYSADLALNDVIRFGKIPAGAKIVDVKVMWDDLDASGGLVDVGWEASEQVDASGTALEAADPDGFLNDLDVTSAGSASLFEDQSSRPGYLKEFAAECWLSATIVGDTDATSGTLSIVVEYVET